MNCIYTPSILVCQRVYSFSFIRSMVCTSAGLSFCRFGGHLHQFFFFASNVLRHYIIKTCLWIYFFF